ncbi:FAD-binding protein [Pseudomonas proteolytica]|uniref:FAD-binding protein n=1 Tax=Pseudomonas proteolytica TaxID=219574 RepID=UPI001473A330
MPFEPAHLTLAQQQWREVLGDAGVRVDPASIERFAQDTMCSPAYARVVIAPRSTEHVSACMEIARRYGVAVHPISTGHNWGYGSASTSDARCVLMDLSEMNRILGFDEELSVVTLEPGVTQGDLARYLQEHNLPWLTPVTGAGPTCSVLGNALERGFGITPHTDHFQAVLGIEAVLADGTLYRSPMALGVTAPCFKWGVGPYLDGLFSQSGLGVVTQMSIALVRKPEVIQPFYFWVDEEQGLEAALAGIKRMLDLAPGQIGGINLMNRTRLLTMASEDTQVVGMNEEQQRAAADALGLPAWMGVGSIYCQKAQHASLKHMISRELEAFASKSLFKTRGQLTTARRLLGHLPGGWSQRWQRTLGKMLQGIDLMEGHPSEVALPLAYTAGAKPLPDAPLNPARDNCGLIWYAPILPLKIQEVADFVHAMERRCRQQQMPCPVTLTSLSSRAIDCTVPLLFDRSDAQASNRAHECYHQLFAQGKAQGVLPYRVPTRFMHLLTDAQGPAWQLGARIKAALDPDNLLSPGRYCATNPTPDQAMTASVVSR